MQARLVLSILATGAVAMGAHSAAAQNRSAALTGQVTSDAEGTMEGVVVSARKAGSTVTMSVMSDAQGRYSFPADRLSSGKYTIAIRAAGYDLAARRRPMSPTSTPRRSISSSPRRRISPPS